MGSRNEGSVSPEPEDIWLHFASAISTSMSIVSSLEDDMVPLKGLQAASCKIKLAQVEKSLK